MDKIQLGIQSFKDLGAEFVATIFGLGPTGKRSVVCGAPEGELNTFFYLDFSSDEGDCAGSDWIVILILGVIIHAISWWSRWLVWEPLANLRMKGHKSWTREECQRYSQTCTSAMFFVLSAVFAARILLPKEWLFKREGWTMREHLIEADYKFYYLVYAARFFSDLVSIFFEDRKKEAFIAAFIHHLTTLALVLGSAYVGHTKYGGIIMFFFDWADLPLLFAKICKYLSKDPADNLQWVANRLFEVFAILFFLTRNCYFNYVVYSCCMDLSNDLVNRYCQYLLIVLVVLQTYWMYLIIQAAIRQGKNGGNVEDVREDSDGVVGANGKKND